MPIETPSINSLRDNFLQALNSRNFDKCQALLATIQRAAVDQPNLAPQALYCEGLLANEAERDMAKAERLFKRALAQEKDTMQRARILRGLGIAYDYQQESTKALATFRTLAQLYTEMEQPFEQARTLKNMAIACEKGYARGDLGAEYLANGESYCRQALALLTTLKNPPPALAWEQATTWNTLGALYLHLERWPDAIACYEHHLAYAKTHDDSFSQAIATLNLGEIYHLQGANQWEAAQRCYLTALSIFRALNDSYEVVGVLANLAALYQARGLPDQALATYQEAIELAETLRAGVTSETGRAGYFATVETLYAKAILCAVEERKFTKAFEWSEQARARALLDRIALQAAELARNLAEPVMTLAEMQASLPSNALLLAYFTTGLLDAQAEDQSKRSAVRRHRFPPARVLLFAVTADSLQVHELALSPNLLRPNHLENVVERHFLNQPMLRTLYQKLIEPVEMVLHRAEQVYLLPHGPLHYIPFQALLAADGEPLVSATGPTFTYAPSATTLLGQTTSPIITTADTLFAIGYNATTRYNLHYAEAEAQMVAERYKGSSLVSAQEKKNTLFSQANAYRLLHFSCHGEFIADEPLTSFLLIGEQERLTAQEIMDQLHLNCDLVTLSACESGLSRIRRGDELLGLLRAFFYAGAQALLATLWRVDEQATYLFMHHFYAQIQAGQDFAAALKTAQIYLRNITYVEAQRILNRPSAEIVPHPTDESATVQIETPTATTKIYADPRYWAPFVLFSRSAGRRYS
ncbi:MAG: CHAT domain-containing tetratricopeptide repeat protein [Caldilineaceae bacterium]